MKQKTALVTGGTAGVGLSIVRGLTEAGAFVHFIGTNPEKGSRVEEELNGQGSARCQFIQLDLSSMRGIRDFAADFASKVPQLDVLANVAGVLLTYREETDEGIEKTLAIDHLAAFLLCRELAPQLAAAEHGRILNVSGRPSLLLKPRLDFDDLQLKHNYSLLKAALNAVHAKTVMTEILAERLAPDGVDVNAFHPGAVKSDLLRDMRFPLSVLSRFARLFMSPVSKSGIYACTSEELNGVTGQLFVGTTRSALSFEQAYKDRLTTATEAMLEQALRSRET